MASVAGLRAIATAGLQPDDIDLILVGTLTPDYPMPSTAALVKAAIGNKRAAAMDLAAACSGFVYGYATAHAYIAAGMAKHVLVIGAETLSRVHGLDGSRNVHPLRRRGRGGGSVRFGRAGRNDGHRDDDRAVRARTSSGSRPAGPPARQTTARSRPASTT